MNKKFYPLRWCCTVILFGIVVFSCGTIEPQQALGTGSAVISVSIHKPAGMAKSVATAADSLVITVSGSGMSPLRSAYLIDSLANQTQTISGIPTGAIRYIQAFTKNKQGDTIHVPAALATTISAGAVASVALVLMPRLGSIYVSLSSVPTAVDSVYASFTVGTTVYSTKVKRDTKSFLAIDNIPYNTTGTLTVAGLTAANDTVGAAWHKTGFAFTNVYTTFEATFKNDGKVALSVNINQGGVTLIHGVYDTTLDSIGNEQGPIIISEIMYYADSDSDFIELFNPTTVSFSDSLIIDVDGDIQKLGIVTVAAHSFLIVANKTPSWTYAPASLLSAPFKLAYNSGSLFVKRSGNRIMDFVSYMTTSTNALEWPAKNDNVSIVLDSLVANPEYNNYGRHWKIATSLIPNSTTMYGTPGH